MKWINYYYLYWLWLWICWVWILDIEVEKNIWLPLSYWRMVITLSTDSLRFFPTWDNCVIMLENESYYSKNWKRLRGQKKRKTCLSLKGIPFADDMLKVQLLNIVNGNKGKYNLFFGNSALWHDYTPVRNTILQYCQFYVASFRSNYDL